MATTPTVPTLDYIAGTSEATFGMLGNWSLDLPDGRGIQAGQAQCFDWAAEQGIPRKSIVWTDAARKAGWAAFRARYNRRRR